MEWTDVAALLTAVASFVGMIGIGAYNYFTWRRQLASDRDASAARNVELAGKIDQADFDRLRALLDEETERRRELATKVDALERRVGEQDETIVKLRRAVDVLRGGVRQLTAQLRATGVEPVFEIPPDIGDL